MGHLGDPRPTVRGDTMNNPSVRSAARNNVSSGRTWIPAL
jgi:hypothetical protein